VRVDVIFTTYNQPLWLEKTLWGFAHQTHRDFRILIADDGSGSDTADTVERMRGETGLEIEHVWHEDDGFRKCAIMNRALEQATASYVVFTDGDCIPRSDFLEAHVRLSAPSRYLSGGLLRLTQEVSDGIDRADVDSGRAFDPRWLRAQGQPSRKLVKLKLGPSMAALYDLCSPTNTTWNGHNASCWTEALLAANGFDERMAYGAEDCELGERLRNAGYRGKRIRHRAITVHLEHARGYVDQAAWDRNNAMRAHSRRSGAVRTPCGIERKDD